MVFVDVYNLALKKNLQGHTGPGNSLLIVALVKHVLRVVPTHYSNALFVREMLCAATNRSGI